MAKKLYEESSVQAIADAIRAKNGSSTTYKIAEMSTAINEIKTGFPNGTEWTLSNITDKSFEDILYVNKTWVIYNSNSILYSTNGKEWNTIINDKINYISKILYFDKIGFIGIVMSNYYLYSSDGITWQDVKLTDYSSLCDIIYVNNIGKFYMIKQNYTFISDNCLDWDKSSNNLISYFSVVYLNNIFFNTSSNSSVGISYSTDAITWTKSNLDTVKINDIQFHDGIYVAVSDNGVYYSTNGIEWTQSNISSASTNIVYTKGLWVIGSQKSIYYSLDGKEWIQGYTSSASSSSYDIKSLCYADGLFIANRTYDRLQSNDGKNWEFYYTKPITDIVRANGIYVGRRDGELLYLEDGSVWKYSNIKGYDYKIKKAVYADGIWIAFSYNTTSSTANKGLYYSVAWES